MVPKITINNAYKGPALPIMDENAIKLDRAHRNAPVIVAK